MPAQARERQLLSNEHFTVDGTLVEAWASQKSFRPKDGPGPSAPADDDPSNPTVSFRGERRSNATHASTSDPEARLYRKGPGQPARLCYLGHVLMENRHGLAVKAPTVRARNMCPCGEPARRPKARGPRPTRCAPCGHRRREPGEAA